MIKNPSGKSITLNPVRPNVGVTVGYRKKLDALIARMQADIIREIRAQWRKNPPEMAQDESPANELRGALRRLMRRWTITFADLSPKLASYFAQAARDRAERVLANTLEEAGMTVKFRMTREVNDAYQAVIGENVGLIRSIAAEHLTAVEGAVMRSVQVGRDLGTLTKELEHRYVLTRKRAALIARDQNNKATAVITKTRQEELGITKAIWMHSTAGKRPRPEHLAFNNKTYDVAKGAFLEGKWTWPGVEINCRCVSRAIVPGFS